MEKKNTKIMEQRLLDLLSETASKECCWCVLEAFIDYVQVYDEQVRSGKLIEESLVAGTYPMTQKVENIDWDGMRRMIKVFKETIEAERAQTEESE